LSRRVILTFLMSLISAVSFGAIDENYLTGEPTSPPVKNEKIPLFAGMGEVDFSLLLQEWYIHDNDDNKKDTFRTRRAELGVGGKLMEHFGWKLSFDPSQTREENLTHNELKDAYVDFEGIPHHTLKLGQYKIPLTEEGFRSASKIDTVENSYLGRTYGGKRDIGFMVSGNWEYAEYQIGVFNGDESNRLDTNDQKDLVVRGVLKPFPNESFLKGLELGASVYHSSSADDMTKKRRGIEARYEYAPFSLKSETIKAEDGAVKSNAWYLQTGYFFLPRWQGVLRYEGIEPDESESATKEKDATVGLNYFLVKAKTKIQLQYTHKDMDSGPNGNQMLVGVQYSF